MRKPDRPKSSQIFRCAIYTRKSSDDGLEQEFNSLDAQREACEAYVTSQRHAGWIALPEMYDDGGLSGGTRVGALADQQAFPLRFHTSNGNNDGCVSAYRPRRPFSLLPL